MRQEGYKMLKYYFPLAIVVLSSVGYQVGLKEVSSGIDPIVALVVTYLASSVTSFVVYFLLAPKGEQRLKEITKINPAALLLGLSIVGIEVGCLYMFVAGWPVNTAFVVSNSFIVLALMILGRVAYHEILKPRQLAGVVISMVGIFAIVMG